MKTIQPNEEASAFYGRPIWTVALNELHLDSDEVLKLADLLDGAGSDACMDLREAVGAA
jgi:hypothetical protein